MELFLASRRPSCKPTTIKNWGLSGLAADKREWIETICVAVNIAEPVFEKSVAPRKRFGADTAASTKSARATR